MTRRGGSGEGSLVIACDTDLEYTFGGKYRKKMTRMDQVKFVKDSLEKI